jgi:hypothetical protein
LRLVIRVSRAVCLLIVMKQHINQKLTKSATAVSIREANMTKPVKSGERNDG